ncbi:MAG: PaaI family thioesterase [Zhongshania sp.]|jgi:uncharacterized protein (TIGR00369 family)|nr:PaaI family thioesterase [Zhongshania sp.]
MAEMEIIPEGFEQIMPAPGFDEHIGKIYQKQLSGSKILGFRVRDIHLNKAGSCHGGVLTYLADMQLAAVENQIHSKIFHYPTKNLNVDFIAPVPKDAWVEVEADLVRETKSTLYSQALMKVDGRIVVRTTACYHIAQ